MKRFLKIFMLLACSALLGIAAYANTVYVTDNGTGDGQSESTPIGTFKEAVDALGGKGGTIVLVGDVTSGDVTFPEQSGDVTVTAITGAKMLVTGTITLGKNTNSNTFTFDMPVDVTLNQTCSFVGNFNSVVFTESFSVAASGGSDAAFDYYGGAVCGTSDDTPAVTELPYSITVNGGTFSRFECGNYRSESGGTSGCVVDSVAAPVTVTINGGSFGAEGDYSDALNPNNISNGFSLSGMSILADGGTLTVNGGTFNVPIYLLGRKGHVNANAATVSKLTASDRKYYAADGDITLKITGGTFNGGAVVAGYTEVSYSQLLRGNVTVEITGGSFKSGTVFDATQVKAYDGENKIASITYPEDLGITVKRFDEVNGETVSYTEPTRIAFIGDSITEGHSSTHKLLYSYPAQYLENALADGEDVIVSNFGVSGSTMNPTGTYYPDMLAYPIGLEEVDADIYFFALGINDSDYVRRSNGALEEWYTRYKSLIKEHGDNPDTDKVYLTSICPIKCAFGAEERRASAFSLIRPTQQRIIEELKSTDESKYEYIDLYALLAPTFCSDIDSYLKDGVHPNDTGYAIYGETLYEAVKNNKYTNDAIKMTDIYVSDSGTMFGAGTADEPISGLAYALSLCADTATIHIIDTITFNGSFTTPINMDKLTIAGEGDGATFQMTTTGSLLFVGSTLKFENLNLVQKDKGESTDLTIIGNYNDIELAETFTNQGTLRFYAGKIVFGERSKVSLTESMHFDTEATASSSNECDIKINGGKYTILIGGNRLFANGAPLGTYSGNMYLTVGENVTVSNEEYSGMNGMNYYTGNIIANINGWGDIKIKDNSVINYVDGGRYDPTKNTGDIYVTVADGVGNGRVVAGDFSDNGETTVEDVLLAIKHLLNHTVGNASTHFYGVSEINLRHAIYLIKKVSGLLTQ